MKTMSRFVDSVLKLVHRDRERGTQKLRNGKRKPRRKIRDRSIQYADSFIFVPGEIDADAVNFSRLRAHTCLDNFSPSSSQGPIGGGVNLGKSLKSRLSQEVEDKCFHDEEVRHGSQDTYFADASSSDRVHPPFSEAMSYEICCPPGERYCHIRPHSISAEYSRPTDCIRPNTNSWHPTRDSDLESIDEDEGDYATVGDPDKLLKTLGRPLSPRDVLLGERIGEGQFGDVHTGVLYPDTTEEAHVAVKTCKSDSAPEEKAKFLQEAAVMKQFNHSHIIKLFGVVTQGFTTYIVMELAPLGQLRQYLIQKNMEIPQQTLLEYIRQLCSAMVHLEQKNYVHRDIAARNILVVSPDKIKLSDFGLSRWLEEADFYVASRGKLPIKWMAPESINFRRFTGASDVWMFGVCSWEILMRGVKPFMGIKNDEVIGKLELGERLSLPPECPGPLFNLMNHCWQYDSEDRPTFRDLEQQIEYILEEEWKLTNKGMLKGRSFDGPPLPPRNPSDYQMNKRRSGNIEERHHLLLQPTLSNDSTSSPPPPLPPRPPTNNGRPLPAEPLPNSPPNRHKTHGSDSSVDPYLVTNILGSVPPGSSSSSSSTALSPPITQPPPSPSNRNQSMSPIPPPAILRNQQHHHHQHQPERQGPPPSIDEERRRSGNPSEGVYYSTVSGEDESLGQTSVSQLKLSREASPYEISQSKDELSPSSNTSLEDVGEEEEDDEDDNNEVLECTTGVVKAVMSLSTTLPDSKPSDYPELVKSVGVALRELLAKVDHEMDNLVDQRHQTHQKVQMAHKVLSSDMAQLVKSMKDLQENYHSFLMDHYQKQMLQSAAIIAVNSKHLLEAYNKARRLSRRGQR